MEVAVNKYVIKIRMEDYWSYANDSIIFSFKEIEQSGMTMKDFFMELPNARKLFKHLVFERFGVEEAVLVQVSHYYPYAEYAVVDYYKGNSQ